MIQILSMLNENVTGLTSAACNDPELMVIWVLGVVVLLFCYLEERVGALTNYGYHALVGQSISHTSSKA